jgi:cation:H+ antiporter
VAAGEARADLLVMLGFSLLIWPFLRFDYRIRRWEGAVLLLSYAGYIAWLASHPS